MAKTKKTKSGKITIAAPTTTLKPLITLADLKADPALWYRMLVLIYDFHHSKENASNDRLNQTTDGTYISLPYFSPRQATRIKAIILDSADNISLEAAIGAHFQDFLAKRRASGDFRPCGAHDMGPAFLKILGIGKEEVVEEKFVSRVRRSGVRIG